MELSRKEFVLGSLAAAGAALMGVACGDDTTSSGGSNAGGAGNGGSSDGGAASSGGSPATGGAGTGGTPATGGAPGTGGAGGGAPTPGCVETIALNHGHVLEVTVADVNAGVEKIYDIMGSSLHTHTVTVGAADFALLAQGMPVMLVTSLGGMHTHNVTVTCTL